MVDVRLGSDEVEASTVPPLIVVVGPTASGKSRLALDLAERVGGEVIGADSVQIYRYFDIGSGKPSADEMSRVPHHLIGQLEPTDLIDASSFAKLADTAIADVISRGKVPILCGGTFLWVKAVLYGLAKAPPADEELRQQHRIFVEQHGRAALHARLERVDSLSYQRLNPNDMVRVSRALEVLELTGRPLSDFHLDHGFRTARYPHRLFGVHFTPDELTERIRIRVTQMLDDGWRAEVDDLLRRGFGHTRPMASVGYRQVAAALQQSVPLSQLLEDVVRVTRIFARRQRTWLREQPVHWLSPGEQLPRVP